MRKRGIVLAAFAAVAAFAGGVTYGHTIAPDLKPCQSETSNNCYWDASRQGNGRGRSFIVDRDGHVTYVSAFNQGFADSKADDCEQGFQSACAWLATTR